MTTNPPRSIKLEFNPEGGCRVLTLRQPWASLMAWGEKAVETRGQCWNLERGGPWWAIHSSADGREARQMDVANESAFTIALARHAVAPWDLPLGKIVAIVRPYVCLPTQMAQVSEWERAFGDYGPGRFAYFCDSLQPLAEPIPWKGGQGLRFAPLELKKRIAAALK